jgi:hypothetical protein
VKIQNDEHKGDILMRVARHWLSSSLMLVSMAVVSGCSGEVPLDTTTTEGTVKGTIKVRGKTMRGGSVTLDPTGGRKTVEGAKTFPVKDDGTFEGTTIIGKNRVRIGGPAITKEPTLGYASKEIEVKSGDNPVDLDFP